MEGTRRTIELPERVPVLPVRNTVLFPNAAVPLIVGRPRSLKAVRECQASHQAILVVAQKDGSQEDPGPNDLYSIGTICLISKVSDIEKEGVQLVTNGLFRFEVSDYVEVDGYLAARGVQLSEPHTLRPAKVEALSREIKNLGKAILSLAAIPGSDALTKLFQQLDDPLQISDLCCTFLHLANSEKQELLECRELDSRMEKLFQIMLREKEKLGLAQQIQSKMMERLSKDQRDHLLREQLRTIHEELGDEQSLQGNFAKKIESAGLSPEAKKVAQEELGRLSSISRSSPEYHVIRTYLDSLLALPWKKTSSPDNVTLDLDQARKILDEDHFGIEKVKKRILQFLAVTKLKKDLKGPILCLLGPPGVGKTSVSRSIAKALGRQFIRTSLGGVRDEAEIRGHRRTYIGALPGRLLQNIKRIGVNDPVMLLDEIDKVGNDFRGDPASALLEALDPEQNSTFLDHYFDVPFDLSHVFFLTTANTLETIPPALRDRLEVIEMTSYSREEKLHIAEHHLLRRTLADHGITPGQFTIDRETLGALIDRYTREAGVRNLQRELAQTCRYAAEKLASNAPPENVTIRAEDLDSILGPQRFFNELAEEHGVPGVVTGLAWTATGGEILKIEVSKMDGKGKLVLTGKLGDVMKESAQIALSRVRADWAGSAFPFDKTDFHIHVPSGAIPKDGPSAGVALYMALTSLVCDEAVSPQFAMTGEITLRGTILPVGGIKEKVLAAHRAGIKTLLLPLQNKGSISDIPDEVKADVQFHWVSETEQLLTLTGLLDKVRAHRRVTSDLAGSPRYSPQIEVIPPPPA